MKRQLKIKKQLTQARKKVREALDEWAMTFNSISDLVSIQDKDFRIIKANKALAATFGVPAEKLIGKKCYEIIHGTEEPWPECPHQQALQCGKPVTGEFWEPRLGRYLQVSVSPIVNKKNEMIGTVHIAQDITERKRAEEALRRSEQRFRNLVETTSDWVWEVDQNGVYTYVSPRIHDLLGYRPEEVIGKTPFDLMPPGERERIASIFAHITTQGKPFRGLENVNQHRDGHLVVLETNAVPFFDTEGTFLGYRGIDRDITERKRAEEALRESEEKYRILLDESSDPIFTFYPEGRYRYVNKAFARAIGLSTSEIIGKTIWDVFPKDEADKRFAALKAVFESGQEKVIEVRIPKPDKDQFCITTIKPILEEGGRVLSVICSSKDITGRKQAEEEIRQLLQSVQKQREELRALGARLSEVEEDERRRLSGELHDRVGQNLTALGINLNILRNQLPAETAGRAGKALEDSLRLVVKTVEDIRNVMAELRPPLLDEYGLLAALRWYGKQFSERTGLNTVVEGGETMSRLPPEVEIALFRITQEALTNVAKHGRASRVTVTLEEVDKRTTLTIADNGAGFDPQASRTTAAATKWGLILIRERAEVVGGQVRIDSGPGKGTRIVVEVKG